MTDYGQPLRFGAFITPSAADPAHTVALAIHSEAIGLDLVTFQDHPYQPALLDTWTLLAWVAARTRRIHVSGNVLSLPFRPAPVLARATASLDLLSSGRVELGLGPGAFWDAVEAMGVLRLTPAESVTALDQAIDVIRGIWDTQRVGPLQAGGALVHVDGAKRGPAPAHDIPIVLGAYKPRMLRLTGEKADGWVPSLGYLQPGDLARGNAIIDAAAIAVGRRPAHILRHLIIPPSLVVDDLVRLALEEGISSFIVASDDPATLEHFSSTIAPAVRGRVLGERESTTGRIAGATHLPAT
jgi:alkanesulfonate monooxygenase SsuD/methylene tetrahydromethanopterin reductase-like flavin-dependent oxidoreductase (luciferase family)